MVWMMRFLCVVVMLQVSTPFVHGMKEDVELAVVQQDKDVAETTPLLSKQNKDVAETTPLFSKPLACWQTLKRYLSKKKSIVGCALGCVLLTGVGIWGVVDVLSNSDLLSFTREFNRCPKVVWDRGWAYCREADDVYPFTWAIIECQAELIGKEYCTRVCDGNSTLEYIPVGWKREMHLSGDPNCSKVLEGYMGYGICSPKKADDLQVICDKKDIPYCRIDTENGVGFVISWHNVSLLDHGQYGKKIAEHPEDMEERCGPLADKARQLANCAGSFASTWVPPKRTKGKRRTQ